MSTLKVEKLTAAVSGLRVRFSYRSTHTASTVFVSGILDEISWPQPYPGGRPATLTVEGLPHAVPDGTLINIETGETR